MGSTSMLGTMTCWALISTAWHLRVPKYPIVGTTETDAAEAATDMWEGTPPSMPYKPEACLALPDAGPHRAWPSPPRS